MTSINVGDRRTLSVPNSDTPSADRAPRTASLARYGIMALVAGAAACDAAKTDTHALPLPHPRKNLDGLRPEHLPAHRRSLDHPVASRPPIPNFVVTSAANMSAEHLLGDLPVIYGGLWLTKQEGQFHVRDDESAPGRHTSMLAMLEDVNRWNPELHDFEPIFVCTEGYQPVCQGNAPNFTIPGEHVLAIHLNKNRPPVGWRPTPHLIPDNTFQDWALVGIDNYDETCRNMSRAGDVPAQINLAGWVGNVEMNPLRRTLVELAASHPKHIEAVNTGQWQLSASGTGIEVSIGKRVSMVELVQRYAYLIDVEGMYSSFRLKMLYHSNRPLLVQERRFDEWWTNLVKPWVHYVPVAYDLHDLTERVDWLRFNPAEGAAIAHRARDFARGHLQRGHAIEHWARTLEALPLAAPVGEKVPQNISARGTAKSMSRPV